ncbi:MAG TPA: DUF2993 domain-containing protein [bacterium]|nr:DUF2993 domain-containing protein [bacterium]
MVPGTRGPARTSWWRPGALWLVVVAVLAAALAASLEATSIASTAVRLALVRSFGTPDVAVTVEAQPASAVWWGHVRLLSVAARSLHIGQLDVSGFEAVLTRVVVDPVLLYGRGELTVRSMGAGVARVTVTADELARLLAAQSSVKHVLIRLKPGTITLDGTMSVLGADVPASVAGRLAVRDASHLDLIVDRATVMNGLPVPADVASRLGAAINPVVDLGGLPFGLHLTKVSIGDGVLMLQAVAGPPAVAGGPP